MLVGEKSIGAIVNVGTYCIKVSDKARPQLYEKASQKFFALVLLGGFT